MMVKRALKCFKYKFFFFTFYLSKNYEKINSFHKKVSNTTVIIQLIINVS